MAVPSDHLVQVLQVSVSPVVLISGVGLLLLSMTNRLGRVVDRARILAREMRTASEPEQRKIRRQLRLLARRARLLRSAIMTASVSILLVGLIVLGLFATYLLGLPLNSLVLALFAASVLSLVVSMAVFLQDLTLSLNALWLEINDKI